MFKRKKLFESYGDMAKDRRLILLRQLLMSSAGLNVVLIVVVFYFIIGGGLSSPHYEYKPVAKESVWTSLGNYRGNVEVIRQFKAMSFSELVVSLESLELVEDGFTRRDLALASLVGDHYFDIARALRGDPLQKRLLYFGEDDDLREESILIFPGLSEEQYVKILRFIQMERWPFTSQGLFLQLARGAYQEDTTLLEAFYMTAEFSLVETLFSRAEYIPTKQELLSLLLDGDWQMLYDFTEQQRLSQDLSALRRQNFLLDYIVRESSAASNLILKTDFLFASKKLDDNRVLAVLGQLEKPTENARLYALELLTSPRSDTVWKKVAARLYSWEGKTFPDHYTHMEALELFVPEEILKGKIEFETEDLEPVSKKEFEGPLKSKLIEHVVVDGDTLWEIAREYHVDVKTIKEINDLVTDVITPGTQLDIPVKY